MPKDISIAKAAKILGSREAKVTGTVNRAQVKSNAKKTKVKKKTPASSFAPRGTKRRSFGAPVGTPLVNRRANQSTDSNN